MRLNSGTNNILFEKRNFLVRALTLTISTFWSFPTIFRSNAKFNTWVITLFADNWKIYFNKTFYDGQNLDIVQENESFDNNGKCWKKAFLIEFQFETYSELNQTARMKLLEIIVNISAVNYFRKKLKPGCFDWVLNTLLCVVMEIF